MSLGSVVPGTIAAPGAIVASGTVVASGFSRTLSDVPGCSRIAWIATPATTQATDTPSETLRAIRPTCHTTPAANSFFNRPYSRLSTSARKLASMMFSSTPMVVQLDTPSLDSMSTRMRAAVPAPESTMRTL